MLKTLASKSSQKKKTVLPWAEFLTACCRDCFNFIRDEPLSNVPSCFKRGTLKTIQKKWKEAFSLMEAGAVPPEMGLEIVWPSFSGSKNSKWNFQSPALELIRRELEQFSQIFDGLSFSSLSIGDGITSGGAISDLDPLPLREFITYLRTTFKFSEGAAISIKGSVETLTRSKLDVLVSAGVSRVVLDVQNQSIVPMTFSERKSEILAALSNAPDVTLDIDIVVGREGQTLESITEAVERALSFSPHAIYLYLEGGSYLGTEGKRLTPESMAREKGRKILEFLDQFICRFGYKHQVDDQDYLFLHPWERNQIRAKKKRRASVLGVGNGSLSHIFGSAWYCRPPIQVEDIQEYDISEYFYLDSTIIDEMRGYIIGALLQTSKISRNSFKALFGKDVLDVKELKVPLMRLFDLGLIRMDSQLIRWNGEDTIERALWLKQFHNPNIVRSILTEKKESLLAFVNRFEQDEAFWREMATERHSEQDSIAYWNPKALWKQ